MVFPSVVLAIGLPFNKSRVCYCSVWNWLALKSPFDFDIGEHTVRAVQDLHVLRGVRQMKNPVLGIGQHEVHLFTKQMHGIAEHWILHAEY